jgi:hypothetical protein
MSELPPQFYYIVGSLILTNLGAIGTLMVVGAKSIWWVSKLDSKVTRGHERQDNFDRRLERVEERI